MRLPSKLFGCALKRKNMNKNKFRVFVFNNYADFNRGIVRDGIGHSYYSLIEDDACIRGSGSEN